MHLLYLCHVGLCVIGNGKIVLNYPFVSFKGESALFVGLDFVVLNGVYLFQYSCFAIF